MKYFFNKTTCFLFVLLFVSFQMHKSFAWKPAKSSVKKYKKQTTTDIIEKDITHTDYSSVPNVKNRKNRQYVSQNLDGLIQELLTYNPQLLSLVNKINAAKDKVFQAAWIDDPKIRMDIVNLPTGNASFSRTPMTGIQIYLRQKVPFPSKLVTRRKLEKARYEQTVQTYLEKINHLVASFKKAYFEYAFTAEAITINERNKRRLIALGAILEARYATGKIPQQDVLKTNLETENIRSELIKLVHERKYLLTRINTLLVRPPEAPLKIIRSKSDYSNTSKNLALLVAEAKASRPWLQRSRYQVKEAEYAHTLAKEDLLPDFDFGIGYRIRQTVTGDPVSGEDYISGGVGISLPFLWTLPKHAKKISEYRSKKIAQVRQKEDLEQEIIYQVSQFYREMQNLHSQIVLYRTRIIPEALTTVDSSMTSYEAGEADYMSLISSELALFRYELELVRYRYGHEQKMADLEMAVGKPL